MSALAGELNVEMFTVKCSDVMSKWYGESEQRIEELFRTAKERRPAILFFDDIDAIAKSRDLYAGDDDLVFPFLELGGLGGVCVHTHVVGSQVKEMVRLFRTGDLEGARALDEELRPSIDLLRVVVNPIAIKCALNLLGHEVGGLRLPLVEATEAESEAVRGCLERLGLLQPAVA